MSDYVLLVVLSIWGGPGGLHFSPILEVSGSSEEPSFPLESRHSPVVWVWNPHVRGCLGQNSGDRILKSPTRVRIKAEGMTDPLCRPWASSLDLKTGRVRGETQPFASGFCLLDVCGM